ncbi:MAG: hypothetical protein QM755_10745 [Luteolibacter sp.]
MNPDDSSEFHEFERQLGQVVWNDPTPHWRAEILSRCVPPIPWLPKPLLIGLGTCWAVTLGFYIATPAPDPAGLSQPGRIEEWQRPPVLWEGGRDMLGYNTNSKPSR